MNTWRKYLTALAASASLTPAVWAQVPAAPAAAGVAAAPAAPVTTIWDKLGISHDALAKCKEKFCGSPLGTLVNNGLKPVSAMTGGIIGCCPEMPTAAMLAQPGAEGDAAKIKKDELEAKKRQAAVRYLGTVDCHWWPDAEKGLINALRADRNECVRHEAALALTRGCCCTKGVIEALTICVSGSEKDGNPSENSERVRMQAQVALTHCLECVPQKSEGDKEKPTPEKPSGKPAGSTGQQTNAAAASAELAAYYGKDKPRSQAQVIEEARRALEAASSRSSQSAMLPTGSHSLADIWARASATPYGQEATLISSPAPALAPIPSSTTERRVETQMNPQGEKYTGILPSLVHNSDSLPKKDTGWRPGTVSYVSTPEVKETSKPAVVAPSVTAYTVATPTVTPKSNESAYSAIPRVTTTSPTRPKQPVAEAPSQTPAVSSVKTTVPEVDTAVHPVSSSQVPPMPAETNWLSVPQLLNVLKESDTAAQREWAADCLSGANCKAHPEVIPAVLRTAKSDSSAIVRAACIRTLDKVHAQGPDVVVGLNSLANDPDPTVQKEATQAMSHINATSTPKR
jgi:hypothetical protein